MVTLRSVVVIEVVIAALLLSTAAPTGRPRPGRADELREALALPGTGLSVMTGEQAEWLATRVGEQMQLWSGRRAGLSEFTAAIRTMRNAGTAGSARAFRDGRTLADVARELGRLMLAEQRLSVGGRCPRIAGCLGRLRAARDAGVPEQQVQRMAREAVQSRDLAVTPDEECREVQQQMCGLIDVLVEGVSGAAQVAGQARGGAQ